MLTTRVIPCLDVRDGRVVKGVRFQNLRDAGDPAERACRYEEDGADELVMLDVSATNEGRATAVRTVREIRRVLSIPLTVGGGISSIEDAARLLDAGADKVSVNSAAVRDPGLLTRLATRFGRQCTVIAVDAARREGVADERGAGFGVLVRSGTTETGLEAIAWVREAEARGAGEVLLTSFDRDGTGLGYDLELLSLVSGAVSIPVIASGGARTAEHLASAVRAGADAVLAATIFHDGMTTPRAIKGELRRLGVCVRVDGELPEVVA
jgi:imidazoleglycerol phosphate synthase cyclase subunit